MSWLGERQPITSDDVKRGAIIGRIKHVLVKVSGVPIDRMCETSSLEHDIELDSLERIETAMALEDEFGIGLSDDEVDAECMATIGGIADYMMTQRGVD